jgi:hypothetical protein
VDQEVLVTSGLRAGRQLLERLAQESFDVTAAAWLRTTDDRQWYLHIVSAETKSQGIHKATLTLLRVVHELPAVPPYPETPTARLESADVRLLDADEHLAKCISDVYKRYSPSVDSFIAGGRFAPYDFDTLVYLYALPNPAPVTQ